jgi:hypothetical protein
MVREARKVCCREAVGNLRVSGSIARPQGLFQARNEMPSVERLGQKSQRSGAECPRADAFVGEGRYEDERHALIPAAQMYQKFDAAHGRHIDVRNHAGGGVHMIRPQELFRRLEGMDDVAERLQQIADRGANGSIVVDD